MVYGPIAVASGRCWRSSPPWRRANDLAPPRRPTS